MGDRPAKARSGSPPAPRAVVLLSGGMDSAVCLAQACADGLRAHCLSFDYGQRHGAELEAARRVVRQLGAHEHRILRLDPALLGGSALTDPAIDVPAAGTGTAIPATYVPARNTIFLALALGWAEVIDAGFIYAGMNAVDYSGYPDCRPEYVAAFQAMANLATRRAVEGRPVEIRTPLMHSAKSDIVGRGTDLGVDFSLTVSCYSAGAGGEACGRCDACHLRQQGFRQAGVPDPTVYAR